MLVVVEAVKCGVPQVQGAWGGQKRHFLLVEPATHLMPTLRSISFLLVSFVFLIHPNERLRNRRHSPRGLSPDHLGPRALARYRQGGWFLLAGAEGIHQMPLRRAISRDLVQAKSERASAADCE